MGVFTRLWTGEVVVCLHTHGWHVAARRSVVDHHRYQWTNTPQHTHEHSMMLYYERIILMDLCSLLACSRLKSGRPWVCRQLHTP